MAPRNILLVEGTDDEHVVKHLCARHHLPTIDGITKTDGVDRLVETFAVRLKTSDVRAIGALVDADTDLQTRWNSLRNPLIEAGYTNVPESPIENGTILEPPVGTLLPRVGIWLMPNNQTCGILEDFLSFLVPTPNPLLDHARESLNTIPDEHRQFATNDTSKALIHTWLAWQEEPGRPFGTAISAR
jgi:hypothetical protein